ncbi:MAG: nitronate monooxygenase [Candidatus Paceibacterota bacterium]
MKSFWSPTIIQGGMGMYVSGWRLAREVSMTGQLGTLSGVCLEKALVWILQQGDPGGHVRRALSHFPFQSHAEMILDKFYVEGGVKDERKIRFPPVFTINPSPTLISLTVCANFSFVWLAKEGHNGYVSINYLEKIAMPHVFSITGAMMADVDFITMGAGIPLQVPSVIDAVTEGRTAEYRIPVEGTSITSHMMSFNPVEFFEGNLPQMKKPGFIPIIASNLLARVFVEKLPESQRVFGFVVEEPTAGGHNAPPRRPPNYGDKDKVNYQKIKETGIPFWIGGSYASPEGLKRALDLGAAGIQAGSIFALSDESEIRDDLKEILRREGFNYTLRVNTDMNSSPTDFPFKVAQIPGTVSDSSVHEERPRICNMCALVTLCERPGGGEIGYRCPAEPIEKYITKGGKVEDTKGRICLCNGLLATVGMNVVYEPALVTMGDDTSFLRHLMEDEEDSYGAKRAVKYLLGQLG